MKKIKIEMIHDVVCSWCNIGYHHINGALQSMGIETDFHYLPFEINPELDLNGIEITDFFIHYKGWNETKLQTYRRDLLEKAGVAGAKIDFNCRTHYFNTHLAHRLIAEAEEQNLGRPLHESLLHAYHAKGANISDPSALREIGLALGMDAKRIDIALDKHQTSHAYNQAVRRSKAFSVQTVPAFIFNDVELIVGSQSKSYFENYFTKFTTESLALNMENE